MALPHVYNKACAYFTSLLTLLQVEDLAGLAATHCDQAASAHQAEKTSCQSGHNHAEEVLLQFSILPLRGTEGAVAAMHWAQLRP